MYVHFVWGTWDRLPLLTSEVERQVYAAIQARCAELRCPVLALGGPVDHVHLLVRLHSSVSQAVLMRDVKGASPHLVSHAAGRARTARSPSRKRAFGAS